MSSILTNNSAMVALQTLRSINKNLGQTQAEISTGKSIGSARDNAAIWSISKTMESDVKGFKAISNSLSLGSSSVGVARQASETVTDLLIQMKDRIVSGQEDNVARDKIQADVNALRDQIESVVGAAQFNGLNLVNGDSNNPVNILSSLDRSANGTVKTSEIAVDSANLTRAEGSVLDAATALGAPSAATVAVTDDETIAAVAVQGGGVALRSDDPNADTTADTIIAGDRFEVEVGSGGDTFKVAYTVRAGDTAVDIGEAIVEQLNGIKGSDVGGWISNVTFSASDTTGAITIQNDSTTDTLSLASKVERGAGELRALEDLTVNGSEVERAAALTNIETMIQSAIDAAAQFGTAQSRIDTQADFVSNLTDALTSGIGSLVDADMEATSARLQALQVQQQLATQSLSIANQGPQNILALFR